MGPQYSNIVVVYICQMMAWYHLAQMYDINHCFIIGRLLSY